LREVGVVSGDVDTLTAGAMAQTRLLPNNVREVTEADCRGIFEAAL
jgi:alcohol dehydrogenase class IV